MIIAKKIYQILIAINRDELTQKYPQFLELFDKINFTDNSYLLKFCLRDAENQIINAPSFRIPKNISDNILSNILERSSFDILSIMKKKIYKAKKF